MTTSSRRVYQVFPSVLLGTLLNVLDAVSTGLLIFPSAKEGRVFDGLQVQAMSIYIMSTITSQLALTLGGSLFPGALGSMLIEVLPFLRSIAMSIRNTLGDDDPAVLPTVMVAYTLTSFLIGIAFLLLGVFRCGRLVEYFPRTVLTGVIGAIGVSLFELGLSLAAPAPSHSTTLSSLPSSELYLPLVMASFLPAFFLSITTRSAFMGHLTNGATQHALYVPIYVLSIAALFWSIVVAQGYANQAGMSYLAELGWLFRLDDSIKQEPGLGTAWIYWRMFDWSNINWRAMSQTAPTIILLVIIGVLNLSVFVPALALALETPTYNMDHEFLGHGAANLLAGMAGTVPNLVVFSNAYFFTKAGGGRFEALIVTGLTMILFLTSSLLLPFIPTILASALVLFLGLELMIDAVWETTKTLQWSEWIVVIGTLIACPWLGFAPGFVAGIGLAVILHFAWGVADSGATTINTAESAAYNDTAVRSWSCSRDSHSESNSWVATEADDIEDDAAVKTVFQPMMSIIRLASYAFFASIPSIEKELAAHCAASTASDVPCSFIFMDMALVHRLETGVVEFLARKIQELGTKPKPIILVICGITPGSGTHADLERSSLGCSWLGDNVSFSNPGTSFFCFEDLRTGRLWCEEYLALRNKIPQGDGETRSVSMASNTEVLEEFGRLVEFGDDGHIFSLLPKISEDAFASSHSIENARQLGIKIGRYNPGDIILSRGDFTDRIVFVTYGGLAFENIASGGVPPACRPSFSHLLGDIPRRVLSQVYKAVRKPSSAPERGSLTGSPDADTAAFSSTKLRSQILGRGEYFGFSHFTCVMGGKYWEICDRVAVIESGPCVTLEISRTDVPHEKLVELTAWVAIVVSHLDEKRAKQTRWQ